MQLLHGIYSSMKINKGGNTNDSVYFFSLNKKKPELYDMYCDFLIKHIIWHLVRDYRYELYKKSGTADVCNFYADIITSIFDLDSSKVCNMFGIKGFTRFRKECEDDPNLLVQCIGNGIIHYNSRTSALHIKNKSDGNDDEKNLLFFRKEEFLDDKIISRIENLYNSEEDKYYHNRIKDLVRVNFNEHENSECTSSHYVNSLGTSFQSILESIEGIGGDNEDNAIVIDGFSQLSDDDLSRLPYSHLLTTLRSNAKISILVFDERNKFRCDGDIVIELRCRTEEDEEYSYHEMRIAKSVFQNAALGWHKYKRRNDEIIVYPSQHLLLSKRYFISDIDDNIGADIITVTYDEALANGRIILNESFCRACLDGVLNRKKKNNDLKSRKLDDIRKYDNNKTGLKGIINNLFIKGRNNNENRAVTTTIIGNPNSFKRTFALARTFSYARADVHTLYVLMGKNKDLMLKRIRCPWFNSGGNNKCKGNCANCYEKIHFLPLRGGCRTAEEFFSILLEQIRFYKLYKEVEEYKENKRILHIVLDDIQRIDYSFPFLRKNSLFLNTLTTLCRECFVDLTILCDKRAERVKELCSLSDNIICIRREENDLKECKLFVERSVYSKKDSQIIKAKVADINKLFSINNDKLSFDGKYYRTYEIGSMKEYWRKTVNVKK